MILNDFIVKIANYLEVDSGVLSLSEDNILSCSTETSKIHGFSTILQEISQEARANKKLPLITDIDTQCQIEQWFDYIQLYLMPGLNGKYKTEGILNELNHYLLARSYFVGDTMTLADLVIFYAIYKEMTLLSSLQKEKYLNLSRWFNHLQQNEKVRQDLARINFSTIYLRG